MSFRLPSIDGKELGPQDFPGKYLLLDFWATWCLPCIPQGEALDEVYPELKDRGIEFLAIDVGEPETLVREHLADHPVEYPVLMDEADTLSPKHGIFILPTVIVLDPEGRSVFRREGFISAQQLRDAVDEVLIRSVPAGQL